MSIDAGVLIEREIAKKARIAAGILAPAQTMKMPILLADHAEPKAASISAILTAILEKRASSRRALKDLLVLFEWPKEDLIGIDNLQRDQSLTSAMRSSLSTQRQAWQLCEQGGIRHSSCTPIRGHPDLFNDPWSSLSESICWWHTIAGKLKDAVAQDGDDEIVMILNDWSASKRGVEFSLKYIGARKMAVISMFSGVQLPISPIQREHIMATCPIDNLSAVELAGVGQAQYTFQL